MRTIGVRTADARRDSRYDAAAGMPPALMFHSHKRMLNRCL